MRKSIGMRILREDSEDVLPPVLAALESCDAPTMLARAALDLFPGRFAVAASFGTESAVLLALVADVDPAIPVLFLDTGKLFPETQAYAADLVLRLGLRRVLRIEPAVIDVVTRDPDGRLWARAPAACCALRKVEPFARALEPFDAWVSGRKRHHGGDRADIVPIEADGAGRWRLNPLWSWTARDLESFRRARGLPVHPLVPYGYASIGCMPCTTPLGAGEDAAADPRAGRWRGTAQRECGIHGRLSRAQKGSNVPT